MGFACDDVNIPSCLFVSGSETPWVVMSTRVKAFSHGQSHVVDFSLLGSPTEVIVR